jgi:hypothetical protein
VLTDLFPGLYTALGCCLAGAAAFSFFTFSFCALAFSFTGGAGFAAGFSLSVCTGCTAAGAWAVES